MNRINMIAITLIVPVYNVENIWFVVWIVVYIRILMRTSMKLLR